jgi:hypothetical protein
LKLMKIKKRKKNRDQWRRIVEKVKTFKEWKCSTLRRRRRRRTGKLQLGSVSHVLMVCHGKRLYSYYSQVFPHIICPALLDVPATGLHPTTTAYFVDWWRQVMADCPPKEESEPDLGLCCKKPDLLMVHFACPM